MSVWGRGPNWPLATPSLKAIAVGLEESVTGPPGTGTHLVSDPSDVALVRAVWDAFPVNRLELRIPLRDVANDTEASKVYAVTIRDTIPLEGSDGLIPPL